MGQLGLEPMVEAEELQVTSGVDSGGGDSSCARSEADLSNQGAQYGTDSEEQYSTDISETRLGLRLGGC